MLHEPAVELCDLIWLLNPEDSELVQKVRSRAVSQMSRVPTGRNRQDENHARSLLLRVRAQLAL
jgi:hypothetical protein